MERGRVEVGQLRVKRESGKRKVEGRVEGGKRAS